MKINIFQNYYLSDNEARNIELVECNTRNAMLSYYSDDVYFHVTKHRFTFNEFFEMTKEYPNDINIVANSDIYFTQSCIHRIEMLFRNIANPNKTCLALSRHDLDSEGNEVLFNRVDSQDAWCFFGQVPKVQGADFYVGGIAGCDNKIAYLLQKEGYALFNPSMDIKIIHLHDSKYRTWNTPNNLKEQLKPPFAYVLPCRIADIIKTPI